MRASRAGIDAGRELDVLRNVDDNRARTAGGRNIERLVHDARELVHVANEIIVLGAAACDADRVTFLERVRTNEMARNLTGDDDHRNGVHHRVCDRCHHIGGAGA